MSISLTARRFTQLLSLILAGCGTTKMTDTPRAATEMLLVTQAADSAILQIDFSPLNGQLVFLDTSALDSNIVDRGYVVSLVRQQLLAYGALLQEDRSRAVYVVELRVGALGTDRHSMMVGTPAISLPSVVPGLPTNIPEIALIKRSDQKGVAKVAVFAYNRITGRAMWQSGTLEATSYLKDTWVFGTGPFSRGTIRKGTEIAGEPLPTLPLALWGGNAIHSPPSPPLAVKEQFFPHDSAPPVLMPLPAAFQAVTGGAILTDRQLVR